MGDSLTVKCALDCDGQRLYERIGWEVAGLGSTGILPPGGRDDDDDDDVEPQDTGPNDDVDHTKAAHTEHSSSRWNISSPGAILDQQHKVDLGQDSCFNFLKANKLMRTY